MYVPEVLPAAGSAGASFWPPDQTWQLSSPLLIASGHTHCRGPVCEGVMVCVCVCVCVCVRVCVYHVNMPYSIPTCVCEGVMV